ncbi:MAG: 4-(cytidine 5'-diphospho)-2-C-methyl-D-erythritol kinase [Maricaulaceae bacterium]
MDNVVVEQARAKVNLDLRVGPPRSDGYHDLDSVVVFAELSDTLRFEPAEGLSLAVDGPQASSLDGEPNNLIVRAARALAAAFDVSAGARIHLTKRLPVAAGVGGGSADAAASLRGLSRLWDVRTAPERLAGLALALGADVPACLICEPLVMTGLGERITRFEAFPTLDVLLVNPGVKTPTGAVFRAYDAAAPAALPARRWPSRLDRTELLERLRASRNDLEAPAGALTSAVTQTLTALSALPGVELARMSGSGATVMAVFADAEAARAAATALETAHPGWRLWSTRLLGA